MHFAISYRAGAWGVPLSAGRWRHCHIVGKRFAETRLYNALPLTRDVQTPPVSDVSVYCHTAATEHTEVEVISGYRLFIKFNNCCILKSTFYDDPRYMTFWGHMFRLCH